jgi:hypothetical protein
MEADAVVTLHIRAIEHTEAVKMIKRKITYLRRIYAEPSGICHALLEEVLGIRTRFKLAPDAFLWIVKTAADISYRKTARAFFERTGTKISHWLVMAALHEEGRLLLEAAYRAAFSTKAPAELLSPLISHDTLFVEFDGIHIPVQKPWHGPKKLRYVYESNRKRTSFELKSAAAYGGKDRRGHRLGTVHFAADATPAYFWPLLSARIGSVYDVEDIKRQYSSADAAGWCKNMALDIGVAASNCMHYLDRFHLNRECRTAFGKTRQATHFISLACAKKISRMLRDLQLVINHAKGSAKDKKSAKARYVALQSYLVSNKDLIEQGAGPSMGTMEGTNAHVYAARMKVWGGAWSRKGAACMAAVRAQIASGLPLIVPRPDNAVYDDSQIRRRISYEESQLIKRRQKVSECVGSGYEPPQGSIVLDTHMPASLYGVIHYSP